MPGFAVPLFSDTQAPDRIEISLGIHLTEIIQETTTTTDQSQQPTTAAVVLLMRSHMFRQIINPSRQDGDLNLRRTGVLFSMLKLSN